MAATKNILAGSPSAADTLELGASSGIVQFASGADIKLLDIGGITGATSDSQGNAVELSHTVNNVTTENDAHPVKLPAATAGLVRYVWGNGGTSANKAVKIYPASGDKINGGSANAAITIKELTYAEFIALDGENWMAIYTANS